MNCGLYCVFVKEVQCGDLKYGRNYDDYQEGTLVFMAPGQVIDVENKTDYYQPRGHGLVFHPDLVRGTSLAKSIEGYNFFDYNTSEALHLSERERQLVLDCFSKIELELRQSRSEEHTSELQSLMRISYAVFCMKQKTSLM